MPKNNNEGGDFYDMFYKRKNIMQQMNHLIYYVIFVTKFKYSVIKIVHTQGRNQVLNYICNCLYLACFNGLNYFWFTKSFLISFLNRFFIVLKEILAISIHFKIGTAFAFIFDCKIFNIGGQK
jgi:hypothetical protein